MSGSCCKAELSYLGKKKNFIIYYMDYFIPVLNIYVFSYSSLPYISAYGFGHLRENFRNHICLM